MSGWRAIWLVAAREATERLRSRAYIISTALTVGVIGVIIVVTVIVSSDDAPSFTIAVGPDAPPGIDAALQAEALAMEAEVDITPVATDDEARDAVDEGEADAAVTGPATVLVHRVSGSPVERLTASALTRVRLLDAIEETGIDPSVLEVLMQTGNIEIEAVSEPDTGGEIVAVIAIVLLFIAITMYGQWVLMGVLEEKVTRVVEQIISAVSVRVLLAGKVIGIGILGLGQVLILVAGALIGFTVAGQFDIPEGAYPAAAWALLWFVLGFAFYAVLYAAAGSLASRSEDAQAASTPVALVGVASYLGSFIVILPNPDSVLARLLSFLPPVAPIAFPARIGFAGVPLIEILLGAVVMMAATVGVARLAARIYAGALLSSGAKVKLGRAWKAAGELVSGR